MISPGRGADGRLSRARGNYAQRRPLAAAATAGLLQAMGIALFCVSPKLSARARERYRMAPTTSDTFDAFVLADSLRHQRQQWRPLATPSPLPAELRALTRDRERLV